MKPNEKQYSLREVILSCVIVILVLLLIWSFSRRTDAQFIAEFSFAATISSIILLILAIFMSITGESKLAVLREKIEKEVDEIEKATIEMKEILQQHGKTIDSIKQDTGELNAFITRSDQTIPAFKTAGINAYSEGVDCDNNDERKIIIHGGGEPSDA